MCRVRPAPRLAASSQSISVEDVGSSCDSKGRNQLRVDAAALQAGSGSPQGRGRSGTNLQARGLRGEAISARDVPEALCTPQDGSGSPGRRKAQAAREQARLKAEQASAQLTREQGSTPAEREAAARKLQALHRGNHGRGVAAKKRSAKEEELQRQLLALTLTLTLTLTLIGGAPATARGAQ